MRIYSIFGGVAILAVMGASAQFFSREYASVLFSAQSTTTQISRLTNDVAGKPASYRAKLDILLKCDQIMSGIGFGLLVADNRADIRENCDAQAQGFLAKSPDLAYAHYIVALAASDAPSSKEFSDALLASMAFGQFVQWQAERRLALAMKYYDDAPDAAAAVIQNDVANTIQYRQGRELLTKLYGKYGTSATPSWEQATLAIEQASPTNQKRFIHELKASLNN